MHLMRLRRIIVLSGILLVVAITCALHATEAAPTLMVDGDKLWEEVDDDSTKISSSSLAETREIKGK